MFLYQPLNEIPVYYKVKSLQSLKIFQLAKIKRFKSLLPNKKQVIV